MSQIYRIFVTLEPILNFIQTVSKIQRKYKQILSSATINGYSQNNYFIVLITECSKIIFSKILICIPILLFFLYPYDYSL